MSEALFLGLEAVGTGTHPASWRRADSGAEGLFTAHYWSAVVTLAERLGLDAVLLPDSFAVQDGGARVTRGRLDAVAVAARTAPLTRRIGLIPQVSVTHTEPFHVSKAIAALDFASLGRAGWEVTVSRTATESKAFGRKDVQDEAALWHEADEAIEVVTRLWDSWEDGAEIRDVGTGRFIDRDRLHYIDFTGDSFTVKGPAITPRSPQGQPIVTVRADDPESTALAVRRADLLRITAPDLATAADRRTALRAEIATAGRDPDSVRILLDLPVHLADSAEHARAEVRELDSWARHPDDTATPLLHAGTAAELDDLLAASTGVVDGVILRPLALRATLTAFAAHRAVPVPGAEPEAPTAGTGTLRDRLGLPRPASRYATTGAAR